MKGAGPIFIDNKGEVGVLMLHGFTSTARQFKELAEYFSQRGLTVYAPLIAGHGTCPEDLAKTTITQWQESVAEALQRLKSKVKRYYIIGNSFGGNLAFYLAKDKTSADGLMGIMSLGTPIRTRFQILVKLRLYTYGWLKKFHRKPDPVYDLDYTDMNDEVTYDVIPMASLRNFFKFVKKETLPNLDKVKVPALIVHAEQDPVVDPKSAQYIHDHIGSKQKKVFWFKSDEHVVMDDLKKNFLFSQAYNFIREIENQQ